MAIKGSLKEASLPDVIQLLFLGPAHRVPGARRPAELRHDLLRGRPHHLRGDRQPPRPPRRHPRARAGGSAPSSSSRRSIARRATASTSSARSWWSSAPSSRRSSRATCGSRSRKRCTTCSPGPRARSTSRPACAPEREDFLVRINPEFLLLEGARRVDEWSLIEKKIPSFDLIFSVDPPRIEESAPEPFGGAAAAGAAARRHPRRPAGHRRLGAGRVRGRQGALRPHHRRLCAPDRARPRRRRRRSTTAGSTSTGTSGVAFYKAAMLDEALREFRRVADLRPGGPQRAVLSGTHRAPAGPLGRCGRRLQAGRRRAAARGRPHCTTSGCALEQLGRLDEAEAAYGDAAGRARDDARIMLGWSVVALKRGEYQVAQGRLARALELLGGKPAPALWYWAATLASAGLDDHAGALRAARAGTTAYPANPVLQNNLAVLLEAERGRGRRRNGAAHGARRRSVAPADLQEPRRRAVPQRPLRRGQGGLRARGQAVARSRRRPLLQARQHRLQAPRHGTRQGELEPATALNPGHELARANLEMLDLAR